MPLWIACPAEEPWDQNTLKRTAAVVYSGFYSRLGKNRSKPQRRFVILTGIMGNRTFSMRRSGLNIAVCDDEENLRICKEIHKIIVYMKRKRFHSLSNRVSFLPGEISELSADIRNRKK